jgi:putative PEP-CTERM system histidine kinase
MTEQPVQYIVPFITAVVVLGTLLQALQLIKRPRTSFHKFIGVLLSFQALSLLADGIGIVDDRRYLFWRQAAFSGELMLPGLFAFVVVSFLKGSSDSTFQSRWYIRAWAYISLGIGLLGYFGSQDSSHVLINRLSGETEIFISSVWQVCYVFILLGMTVALSQFEQIYRLLTDSERYRTKMCFVGLGSIAFYEIYQSGQVLLTPGTHFQHVLLRSLTTAVATVFIALGWRRSRKAFSRVKISAELAYGSASMILVGAYLIAIGFAWSWVENSNLPDRSLLAGSIGFLAILAVVLVALSRSWQIRARQFLAKHIIRSKHDYRSKWLEVTDSFAGTRSMDEILDSLLAVLGKTFSAGLMSIWMLYDSDKRLHCVRTINSQGPWDSLGTDNVLIQRLETGNEPLDPCRLLQNGDASLASFLNRTHARLCVPIKAQGMLGAMIVLGAQEGKSSYEDDDIELLRMIAHHVGVLLSHARLAEMAAASAELEAFHRFSAFCLHDIKNLAARLSLVVQNAEIHGANPDFQRSAMQTVSSTVDRMMTLMSKLSSRSWQGTALEEVDLCAMVQECLHSDTLRIRSAVRAAQPGPVTILGDRLEVFQLVLNLVLNAQQAGATELTVDIQRREKENDVLLTVQDNGPGIPEAQLRTIFHPLQTTKLDGLGIGLFQCRQTVERHGGSIRMQSMLGEGTLVTINLPAFSRAQESA